MKNLMLMLPLVLLLAGLSGCFGKAPEKTGLEGKPLPSFELTLMDSTIRFNTGSIPAGKPVVLFYFGPACPYSRAQMEDIIDKMNSLKDIRFYIFTVASYSELKSFYEYFHLGRYPNITAGIDRASFFEPYFKVQGVPYLAIYGGDKRLKQVLLGRSDVSSIKEIAFE